MTCLWPLYNTDQEATTKQEPHRIEGSDVETNTRGRAPKVDKIPGALPFLIILLKSYHKNLQIKSITIFINLLYSHQLDIDQSKTSVKLPEHFLKYYNMFRFQVASPVCMSISTGC